MRHDDLMRGLAGARPRHLDPDRPVPEETRRAELARLTADSAAGDATPRALRPRRRWTRPVWTAGLACGVAAAVAAVTLVARPPGGTVDADTASNGPQTPSHVLLAAAERVESTNVPTGDYWYREEHDGALVPVPGEHYRVDVRSVRRTWFENGTRRQWTRIRDLGARPAGEDDERRWRAAGAPRRWDLGQGGPDATWEGRGLISSDAPGGKVDSFRGPVRLDLSDLPTLPDRPDRLRERLYTLVDEHFNAPERMMDRLVDGTVERVALSLPVTPQVRAAAYRLLAGQSGVRDLGEVTDHAGRPGYGVALPDPDGEQERHLIFGRKTGRPLGTEMYEVGDDGAPGRLLAYRTVTEMRWTNEAPGFDSGADRG